MPREQARPQQMRTSSSIDKSSMAMGPLASRIKRSDPKCAPGCTSAHARRLNLQSAMCSNASVAKRTAISAHDYASLTSKTEAFGF